jgi:CRISPR/Cas system-associated exonuclease Cas4 (RecB family)
MDQLDLKMSLRALREQAVWASDLGNYGYCACKISNAATYGEEKTLEMEKGTTIHELIAEEDIQVIYDRGFRPRKIKTETLEDVMNLNRHNLSILQDKMVLPDNRIHRSYYGVVFNDPPIVGVPDAIGRVNRGWFVVFEKKEKVAPDGTPYFGQRLQMAAYLMSLEHLGIEKCFGVVHATRERPFDLPMEKRVFLTEQDRTDVRQAAKIIRDIRAKTALAIPTPNPNKCVPCQYGPKQLDVCESSPLRTLTT